MPLVLLEPKETEVTLDRMDLLVPLDVMVMLELKEELVLLVTKDQLDPLVRRETLDLPALLVLKVCKEPAEHRANPDPRDCQDPRVLLAPLVPKVKREAEVFVESLVNPDLLEK